MSAERSNVCVIIIIMIGTYGGMQRGRSLLIYSPRASQPSSNTDRPTEREEKEIVGLLMVICNNKWGGTLKRITLSARHNTARVNSYTQCQAHINIIFYGHAEIMIRNSSPRVLLVVYNAQRTHSSSHISAHRLHETQITTLFQCAWRMYYTILFCLHYGWVNKFRLWCARHLASIMQKIYVFRPTPAFFI